MASGRRVLTVSMTGSPDAHVVWYVGCCLPYFLFAGSIQTNLLLTENCPITPTASRYPGTGDEPMELSIKGALGLSATARWNGISGADYSCECCADWPAGQNGTLPNVTARGVFGPD